MTPMPFIKAGYVWRWGIGPGFAGNYCVRHAGIIETILYRYFGREPRP